MRYRKNTLGEIIAVTAQLFGASANIIRSGAYITSFLKMRFISQIEVIRSTSDSAYVRGHVIHSNKSNT
jgi:hypothetical protein